MSLKINELVKKIELVPTHSFFLKKIMENQKNHFKMLEYSIKFHMEVSIIYKSSIAIQLTT